MNAVEIEGVSKSFGTHLAVDDLTLSVPEGATYGFIGPNGAGKTTTLRMILNIFQPDSGRLRLFGESVEGTRDPRVGYLPEERGLYRRMGVREILTFFAELKTGGRQRREIDGWLERMELGEWADKKVETLSKGMAQKVQFIAAVIGRPRLLVLDEPFSGLDPVNLDVLRKAVLELRSQGTTVIFSTHDMAVAERMCDFIFMIFRGRKVLDGSLASIQEQYGADILRVQIGDGPSGLSELPGVAAVDDFGQLQELRLEEGTDPQAILGALAERTSVHHFEIAKPSLHDIFVRIAGPGAQEQNHA